MNGDFIETRRKKSAGGTIALLNGGYLRGWYSFSLSFSKKNRWIRTENYRRRTEKEMQSLFRKARF